MSKKKKLFIYLSVLWLLVVFLFAVDEAQMFGGIDIAELLTLFSVLGIIPLSIPWGIYWIFEKPKAD